VRKDRHYAALLAAASRSQGGSSSSSSMTKKKSSTSRKSQQKLQAAQAKAEEEDEQDDEEAAEIEEVLRQQSEMEEDQAATKKGGAKKKTNYSVPFSRVFAFSKPDIWLYPPALFAAMINGGTMPVFAILFSKITTVYYQPTSAMIQDSANQYSIYFLIFSVIVGGAIFMQFVLWGMIAERMTTRVRSSLFVAILRMEIGFFDRKANSVGVLTARLASDAALVKASIADRMSIGVQNLFTLAIGLGIAFYYGWELTLVLFACLPLLVIGGVFQMVAMGAANKEDEEAMKEANQVLAESVGNIRTVTAFRLRDRLVDLYNDFLAAPKRLSVKRGLTIGLGFGFSQCVIFGVYGLAFWYGAKLMADSGYSFEDVLLVFFAITMAGMGAGQAAAMAPDVSKGGAAVSSVFRILDRKSKVDPMSTQGITQGHGDGDINVNDVKFAYPTRSEAPVFSGINLSCPQGTTTVLVGQSGSGKSTIIQLIERFYDPDQGSVVYDGVDTKQANPKWLRSNFGLVSQEPMLFHGSIFENIVEGLPDDDFSGKIDVTTDQEIRQRVEQAAKDANAYEFISQFPDGFDTQVGEGGSMLSGGQKQRVAIARVLIRNPKVLLLDEATAALDNHSERQVQQTIDRLMQDPNRTTIVIAHKLNAAKTADNIAVVDHGVIVEQGTFEQLLAKKAAFYALYKAQNQK
jgi:ABC-type multidrug transport system fused ATPase/permease subunit